MIPILGCRKTSLNRRGLTGLIVELVSTYYNFTDDMDFLYLRKLFKLLNTLSIGSRVRFQPPLTTTTATKIKQSTS